MVRVFSLLVSQPLPIKQRRKRVEAKKKNDAGGDMTGKEKKGSSAPALPTIDRPEKVGTFAGRTGIRMVSRYHEAVVVLERPLTMRRAVATTGPIFGM